MIFMNLADSSSVIFPERVVPPRSRRVSSKYAKRLLISSRSLSRTPLSEKRITVAESPSVSAPCVARSAGARAYIAVFPGTPVFGLKVTGA